MSVNEWPWRRWIVRFHIDWKEEWVTTRTLGPEGEWIVSSHIGWRRKGYIFYRSVKISLLDPTPFKNLKGKPKDKVQKRQYLLPINLYGYKVKSSDEIVICFSFIMEFLIYSRKLYTFTSDIKYIYFKFIIIYLLFLLSIIWDICESFACNYSISL